MAVVKATIKSELIVLYNAAKSGEMTESEFADGMADIIRNAILSATVTVGGVQSGGSTATGGLT